MELVEEFEHPGEGDLAARTASRGRAWEDEDLVFAAEDGGHLLPNRVTKAFRRATRRVGVPHIRLHGLRHSHGTLMALGGINPKVIAERMGHSSVAFFLDTYGHVLPGMQPDAAEQLADLVLGPDEPDTAPAEEAADDDRDGRDEEGGAAGCDRRRGGRSRDSLPPHPH